MNKIEEIKKKIRDLKLKQKMTTGRLEWNDIQREIDILNNELKQLETDKPQISLKVQNLPNLAFSSFTSLP